MDNFVQSLKVLWRSERLIRQNDFRLGSRKIQFNAMAGLVGLFGLVMLSLAVFFALVPIWGHALAALAVGGADLVLAGGLIAYAQSLKPSEEMGMVTEVRDMALRNMEDELLRAEAELVSLKNQVRSFVRNPAGALLPGAAGMLASAVVRGVRSAKKRKDKN